MSGTLTSPRIEVAGMVMKRISHCWEVGALIERTIGERFTEEVQRPQYATSVEGAMIMLLARASLAFEEGQGTEFDRKMFEALKTKMLMPASRVLRDPQAAVVACREGTGLSQRQFAIQAEVPRSSLQDVESGRCDPRVSMLRKILTAGVIRVL